MTLAKFIPTLITLLLVAVILANDTIRTMLINYARSVIYTTAPSFPMLAAIRAGYTLMKDGETQLV